MSVRAAGRAAFLGGLLAAAALPFLARALEGPRGPRCTVDGVPLEKAPVVRIEPADGPGLPFCCIGCAERWLRAAGARPGRILVTDEDSGRPVDAAGAFFVRSRVVAQPATGDRVHAFASRDAAERHARAYAGWILEGPDRPLGPGR